MGCKTIARERGIADSVRAAVSFQACHVIIIIIFLCVRVIVGVIAPEQHVIITQPRTVNQRTDGSCIVAEMKISGRMDMERK